MDAYINDDEVVGTYFHGQLSVMPKLGIARGGEKERSVPENKPER